MHGYNIIMIYIYIYEYLTVIVFPLILPSLANFTSYACVCVRVYFNIPNK